MVLFALICALVGPYIVLTVVNRVVPGAAISTATRMKVGVSLLLVFTSVGHFARPEAMAQMLPPEVPARIAIIVFTGVLEVLAAIGIWIQRISKVTGTCLILMLLAILPSNVYAAMNHVPFGGHDIGPAYLLVRVPFQFLVIGWVYVATDQRAVVAAVR